MATVKEIAQALQPVMDPEIRMSIVDLGLIYGIEVQDDKVNVLLTLTSPMCPYGPMLMEAAQQAALGVAGTKEAKVQLIWDPPWDPKEMCTEETKINLGIVW